MSEEPNPKPFAIELSPSAIAVLRGLFIEGPLWDGDVPSKSGRDELVNFGLAVRHNGWQQLTKRGLEMAISAKVDREKERHYRTRLRALRLFNIVDTFWNPPEEMCKASSRPTIQDALRESDEEDCDKKEAA
jgi:hypothetical protein